MFSFNTAFSFSLVLLALNAIALKTGILENFLSKIGNLRVKRYEKARLRENIKL
tara:strand:+ start:811 stop:972 length:162 start_codon:yes stop_codon:yes gene_type:complete